MMPPVDTKELRRLAGGNGLLAGAIMERAADEIDRLRAALGEAPPASAPIPVPPGMSMLAIAQAIGVALYELGQVEEDRP